ncbi:phosphatase PAP2 family protein [Cellulosimicrobium marinum]|uniref:phosphatase PAP2 family protein n=1 Tax=Cellulosimicrobium marinum TaxID=1638992 RepID=UPI001E29689D|nr:phosphatase PAP2 family protein [Cellulosimicrobium marinum]MCB7136203.1 phosphatase PAP2 family protein [Cellulosimicrobium marinum]
MPHVRRLVAHAAAWDERAPGVAVAWVRRHPHVRGAAIAWDRVFAARSVDVLLLAAFVLVAAARRSAPASAQVVRAGGSVLAGWAAQATAKAVVRRPRPTVAPHLPLVPVPGTSTPSGHVANLATAALAVHDVARHPGLPRARRRVLAGALAAVVVLTALDRVAVGAHRPSDVAVGAALGAVVHALGTRALPGLNHRCSPTAPTPEDL